jgi:hypothetical protein
MKHLLREVPLVFAVLGLLIGCPEPVETPVTVRQDIALPGDSHLTQVNFPDNSRANSLHVSGLSNQTVYLLKVNRSPNTVTAGDGGWVSSTAGRLELTREVSGVFTQGGETILRTEHLPAQQFNRTAPRLNSVQDERRRSIAGSAAVEHYKGESKKFWIDSGTDYIIFTEITAHLRGQSDYANVWVADANYNDISLSDSDSDNQLTADQAQEVADKFAIIYEAETRLFGYEKGGGPGGSGGMDGDPRIQILLFDIDGDHGPSQTSGTVGYFWGKDEYTDAELSFYGYSSYHSNAAEIFYIDAHFTDKWPDTAYSTLAHEFQHMISFNVKPTTPETWFDEMLSQVAEDVMCPIIEISINSSNNYDNDGGHPVNARIPLFLASYNGLGLTEWLSANVLCSYSMSYAFGAFLARNYGGYDFIKSVMTNSLVNEACIDKALGGNGSSLASFREALVHFGEALIFNDSSHYSFTKTANKTVDGTDYTFAGFDIYAIRNGFAGYLYYDDKKGRTYRYPEKGPLISDKIFSVSMGPYSVAVQSCDEWKDLSGSLDVYLEKPANSGVDFYLVVK